MAGKKNSLSGSWLGNYYYEKSSQPFGFEAVFIETDGSVQGSILDDGNLGEANVFGTFADPNVNFTKKYNNSGLNAVVYEGTMSDEGKKIAGSWRIGESAKGRWLAWRQDEEEIPDLEHETEQDEERELEKVRVRPMTQTQRQHER